jgi:hypothetical protein
MLLPFPEAVPRPTISSKFSLKLVRKACATTAARKSRQSLAHTIDLRKLTSYRIQHSLAKPAKFPNIAKLFGKFAKILSRRVVLEFAKSLFHHEGHEEHEV